MKRYIRSNEEQLQPVIEFIMYIIDECESLNQFQVAASQHRVKQRDVLSDEERFDEETLEKYNLVIDSVHTIIEDYKFYITDEGQSGESYSYYIEFCPTDVNGKLHKKSIGVELRLSNHKMLSGQAGKTKDLLIIDRRISNEVIMDSAEFIAEIYEMCSKLQLGDFDHV